MKELEFIEIIKNTLTDSSLIGDDTAFVDGMVFTQDTLVEDVHFCLKTISAYELGQKAICVNLSDLAAAASEPAFVLISLSLPKEIESDFIKEFYLGVDNICQRYNIKVIGGDITGGAEISITVTAVGRAPFSIKRGSARIGDVVFVTGEHGNSRAGLEIIGKPFLPAYDKFLAAHKSPLPRLTEGQIIAKNANNPAIMDTSDGLCDALLKIAEASNVSLKINFNKIPFDNEIKSIAPELWKDWVLFGGEDYELLACASKEDFEKIKLKATVFEIGHVVEKADFPVIIDDIGISKESIYGMSFNHFKEDKL